MIDTSDRGPNDCLECNLVDDSWQAFSQLKDELDGIVGEEFLRSLATLQMKTDIFSGVCITNIKKRGTTVKIQITYFSRL